MDGRMYTTFLWLIGLPVALLVLHAALTAGHRWASTAAAAAEGACPSDTADYSGSCPNANNDRAAPSSSDSCALFLAPSSIRDAGLGVYAGRDVARGDPLLAFLDDDDDDNSDLVVPVVDHRKTLPYRGQRHFASWLGYVWPREADAFYHTYHDTTQPSVPAAFYGVDEGLSGADAGVRFYESESEESVDDIDAAIDRDHKDGGNVVKRRKRRRRRVSAFAPGVASLANSHPDWRNIRQERAATSDDAGGDTGGDTGGGVHSSSSRFVASRPIRAGSELFLDYGTRWHARYAYKASSRTDYETAEEYVARNVAHRVDEILDEAGKRDWGKDDYRLEERVVRRRLDLLLEEKEREARHAAAGHGGTADAGGSVGDADETVGVPDEEYYCDDEDDDGDEYPKCDDTNDDEDEDEATTAPTIAMSDEWLRNNGVCIDRIRAGPSTIPSAGRGAFATTFLAKGTVVAPAPLLVLQRDDLRLYETDARQKRFRSVLNLQRPVGHERLLNYCYGHPDSDLLLLPYTPGVGFINHGGVAPNVAIRWPTTAKDGNSQSSGWWHRDPTEWLGLHPLDVLDQSGKLMMEFVALRDISPGEELLIDYGRDWEDALLTHQRARDRGSDGGDDGAFRHEIGVPADFFPRGWMNESLVYELAPLEDSLQPGELSPIRWAHNGQPVNDKSFRARLSPGTSARSLEYSNEVGATALYEQLIDTNALGQHEWFAYESRNITGEEWYAQRFQSDLWAFNAHFISPWNEAARIHFLRFLGQVGFDTLLDAIGTKFGLKHLTCWHPAFIGLNDCDNSVMHADIHSTGNKGFNILYPHVLVEGSKPELDIQARDANIVVAAKYEPDVAFVLGDDGYHRTSPVDYSEKGGIRLVVSNYCSEIDETNNEVMRYLYDSEHPAPFINQFDLPIKEFHWGNGHTLPKSKIK